MNTVVILAALLGIAGTTFLFPILARIMWGLKRARRITKDWLTTTFNAHKLPSEISILIPAHNEQVTVESTLRSIWTAVTYAKEQFPDLSVHIVVGADGCSDRTSSEAHKGKARVIESKRKGKWKTIRSLVRQSPPVDWVILADCGVQWPQEFLRDTLLHLSDPMLIGLAPRYHNPDAGLIENLLWSIETKLKLLETAAGGPISVHGATVAYRYKQLVETLESLGEGEWINDDIVLPLIMRSRYPNHAIKYATELFVVESRRSSGTTLGFKQHLTRRLRIARGNVQWVRSILPSLWHMNPIAAVISTRRIFRLLWGYWAILLFIGIAHLAGASFFQTVLALLLCVVIAGIMTCLHSRRISNLFGAALASLVAPFYLFSSHNTQTYVWR